MLITLNCSSCGERRVAEVGLDGRGLDARCPCGAELFPGETCTEDPEDPRGFYLRATRRMREGDADGAIADYEAAARGDDDRFAGMALADLSNLLLQCNEPENAEDAASRALERTPEDEKAYLNRAAARMRLERWDEAVADCDQALEIDPGYRLALLNRGLARSYLAEEKTSGVMGFLRTLLNGSPELEAAVADFRAALEGAPPDWPHRRLCEEKLRAAGAAS